MPMILYLIMSVITLVVLVFGVHERNRQTVEHNRQTVHYMFERPLIDTNNLTVWIGLAALALLWPATLLVYVIHCVASLLIKIID